MRRPTMSLTTLPTTRSSQSQVSVSSASKIQLYMRAHMVFAWHIICSHPLLHREEDDDDEHSQLLQRDDPREQPHQVKKAGFE